MAEQMNEKKRLREDESSSESICIVSPEAKRFRDDLLDILDDTEPAEATQDLASVMKSFEEEICIPARTTSYSGDSQPDLGYLFEASDDELGLPPVFSGSSEEVVEENDVIVIPSVAVGYEQIWRSEDEIIPNGYDFGLGDENNSGGESNSNGNGEFLTLDGLFDYSDVYSGQSDYSDFLYRPESLPAL